MTDINPAISIIILNANGLNNPINRQKLSNWIGNMIQLLSTKEGSQVQRYKQIKSKRMKKIKSCKHQPRKARMTTII